MTLQSKVDRICGKAACSEIRRLIKAGPSSIVGWEQWITGNADTAVSLMANDWPTGSEVLSAVEPLHVSMKVLVFRVAHYCFQDAWQSCVKKYPGVAAPNISRAASPSTSTMDVDSVRQPERDVVDGPSVERANAVDDESDMARPFVNLSSQKRKKKKRRSKSRRSHSDSDSEPERLSVLDRVAPITGRAPVTASGAITITVNHLLLVVPHVTVIGNV